MRRLTDLEYKEIQDRLRNKIKNNPYWASDKKSTAYEDAIKSAMSIVSSVYHRVKS